jgi:predicted DCC family thiol-disulfide oxidoreductase YuxK
MPDRKTLVVLFDGGCPMCRRTVRQLRAIDWRHRLEFVDGTDAAARERFAPGLTEDALLVQMYVVDPRGDRFAGFEAVLKISSVVPMLWPLGLVGRAPGIRALGHLVYRTIAANRVRRGRCTDEVCEPPMKEGASKRAV